MLSYTRRRASPHGGGSAAGATGYVIDDTHGYSMHPDAIGIAGTLFLYRETVRIVAGRFEATHARLFIHSALSTLPEHRTALVAAVAGERGKRYLQRQHLHDLGEIVHLYLTELTHPPATPVGP